MNNQIVSLGPALWSWLLSCCCGIAEQPLPVTSHHHHPPTAKGCYLNNDTRSIWQSCCPLLNWMGSLNYARWLRIWLIILYRVNFHLCEEWFQFSPLCTPPSIITEVIVRYVPPEGKSSHPQRNFTMQREKLKRISANSWKGFPLCISAVD